MNTPLISVIVPCFNQGRFLAEAVGSVRAQSVEDWECLIVNDGSTDETPSIAARLAAADPRIRYVEQVNSGVSSARNHGLDLATGRYIQFLDSDDFILPGKFATQTAAALQCDRPVVVISDYRLLAEDGRYFENRLCVPEFQLDSPLYDLAVRWETELSIPVHAFLFDARVFCGGANRFDVSLTNHEDWDCWMRVFSMDPAVIRVRQQHAVYRRQSSSLSVDRRGMWMGFRQAISLQVQRHTADPQMMHLLRYKCELTDYTYQVGWRPRLHEKLADNPLFKNAVPWGIQQFIYRKLAPRLKLFSPTP